LSSELKLDNIILFPYMFEILLATFAPLENSAGIIFPFWKSLNVKWFTFTGFGYDFFVLQGHSSCCQELSNRSISV